MAEDKKSIIVYVEWINIFDELSDEEAGKLVKHLFRYVNDLNPDAPDRLTKLLFEPIKQTLKRDLVKYENKREKNRNNARKRWDKKDAVASDGIKNDANHAVNDNDSVNDIKEEVIRRNRKKKPFVPPTLEEVKTYFKENGYTQGAAIKAFNHYAVAGWHDTSGKPVLNWKQKVGTNWFKDENLIRQYEVVPEFLSGPRR